MPARRLDLGSGLKGYKLEDPEWERLDLNPNAMGVNHIADAFGPLPFPDETFAEARAVDLLEHASYRHSDAVLAEWARILEPGARIYIQCPDFHETARRYIAGNRDALRCPDDLPDTLLAGAAWRLLGGLDDGRYVEDGGDPLLNLHLSLWSAQSLRAALDGAGFEVESIQTNPHPNLQATAYKR